MGLGLAEFHGHSQRYKYFTLEPNKGSEEVCLQRILLLVLRLRAVDVGEDRMLGIDNSCKPSGGVSLLPHAILQYGVEERLELLAR